MADGILILNDDCFLELFKHFSLLDLANFKEAYSSLAALADMEFSRRMRGSLDFNISAEAMKGESQISKQFGSFVSHLAISCSEAKWCDIFSVIGEHFTEKLKSLSLTGEALGRINEADVSLIVDKLENIETLEITADTHKESEELFAILSHCENATSIKLCPVIAIDLPETIFQTNKNLSTLRMIGWMKQCDLKTIVDNLTSTPLQVLNLMVKPTDSETDGDLTELFRLNHLQQLSITCGRSLDVNPFVRGVAALDSLGFLSLAYATLNQTSIATLAQLSPLKVLHLAYCRFTDSSHLESLFVICGSKSLEHFLFNFKSENFNVIDRVDFLKIVEKRKASASGNCLQVTLSSETYAASSKAIPDKLLEANEETIELVDRNDQKSFLVMTLPRLGDFNLAANV